MAEQKAQSKDVYVCSACGREKKLNRPKTMDEMRKQGWGKKDGKTVCPAHA